MSIIETVERLERESAETIASVNSYVERVAAKDAEQEAAIAAQAEEIRSLLEQLANIGDQATLNRIEAVASALDGIQAAIAAPVEPPVLPEPEAEPEN